MPEKKKPLDAEWLEQSGSLRRSSGTPASAWTSPISTSGNQLLVQSCCDCFCKLNVMEYCQFTYGVVLAVNQVTHKSTPPCSAWSTVKVPLPVVLGILLHRINNDMSSKGNACFQSTPSN